MRRLRFFVLLALIAGSASAQSGQPPRAAPPIELGATVQLAPAGDVVGPWQAYAVEMESRTTRDLDLLLRIEDDSYLGVATRQERLSPGGRKRVFLYSLATAYPRGVPPRYRITDGTGRELAAGLLPVSPRGYVANAYQ